MIITMRDSFMNTLTGQCGVRQGDKVLACCSGGMDSMVLLHLLMEAAGSLDLKVGVMHVDHGIRKDASANDALFVTQFCSNLGVPCHVERLSLAPDTPNLEETARNARYRAIFEFMNKNGYCLAATGHTMNDQAETLLYRMVRGSGIRGLVGMGYSGGQGIIRPLLSFTREQIQGYAEAEKIPWVEDSSNRNTDLARNLIRHEVIPLLRRINPSVENALFRLADIAREEGDLVEKLSRDLEACSSVLDWGMVKGFKLSRIQEAHPAVVKHMVIKTVSSLLGEPRGIDAAEVEGIFSVIAGMKKSHTVKRQIQVKIDRDCLVFCPSGKGPYYSLAIPGPGVYKIGPLGQEVRIESAAGLSLRLKSHEQGERIKGRRVVKVLADRGVMKSLRPFWPVLMSGEEPVSIAGIWDTLEDEGLKTEFPMPGYRG
jgi:tRNA(Ile)-lysidine synthetase-like protein